MDTAARTGWIERLRCEVRAGRSLRLTRGIPEPLREALRQWDLKTAERWLASARCLDATGRYLPEHPDDETPPPQAEVVLAASWLDEEGVCRLRERIEGAAQGPRARWWFSERAVIQFLTGEQTAPYPGARVVVRELAPGLSALELQRTCPVPLWAGPDLAPMRGGTP